MLKSTVGSKCESRKAGSCIQWISYLNFPPIMAGATSLQKISNLLIVLPDLLTLSTSYTNRQQYVTFEMTYEC